MFMSMRSLAQHNSLPCIKVWPSSMISKNLLLVGLSIVLGLTALFVCCFETRKVLGLVRHMQATINGSLQSSPHPVTPRKYGECQHQGCTWKASARSLRLQHGTPHHLALPCPWTSHRGQTSSALYEPTAIQWHRLLHSSCGQPGCQIGPAHGRMLLQQQYLHAKLHRHTGKCSACWWISLPYGIFGCWTCSCLGAPFFGEHDSLSCPLCGAVSALGSAWSMPHSSAPSQTPWRFQEATLSRCFALSIGYFQQIRLQSLLLLILKTEPLVLPFHSCAK